MDEQKLPEEISGQPMEIPEEQPLEMFEQAIEVTEQAMESAEASEEKPDRQEEKQSVRGETYDWLRCIVTAIVACVLIFTFFARIVGVVGSSMVPTLHEGDRLITSRLFYTPRQGDIVVLRKRAFDENAIVKRIIATEGQTVDIDFEAGVVYVDGQPLREEYVNSPTLVRDDFNGEITVPKNNVFVMGDNRNGSSDSRVASLGCVDERYILGRAYLILLPIRDFGLLKR